MTNLVLHWHLDVVSPDRTVLDTTDAHNNGMVGGNPVNLPDPLLGSCLQFDGVKDTVLSVPLRNPLTSYTIEGWINPAKMPGKGPSTIAARGANVRLLYSADGTLTHRFLVAGREDGHTSRPGAVPPDAWHHVAVTNDGRIARILVDAVVVAEYPVNGVRPQDGAPLQIAAGSSGAFAGRIAHVRLYDGALTSLEVKRDMAADQSALEAFVRSSPLDFLLIDLDSQPVLYIDDTPGGQTLTLQLTNTSRNDLEFAPITGAARHVALNFRKGTLAAGLTPQLTDPDWLMSLDGDVLSFQWKRPRPLAPGTSVTLRIQGLNADGAAGTRGTRVELSYQNLRYAKEQEEITGTRLQYLDVVNHRGRRDIPLDLRFVGGDRVLSDGSQASSLVVHLTNTQREGTGLALKAGAPTSTFTLSYDMQEQGEDRPWALTAVAAAVAPTLTAKDKGRWRVTALPVQGRRREWTIVPIADTVLKPEEVIELTLGGISALPSLGLSPIDVAFVNVPDYAPGTLTAIAERAPLLLTTANVGIGTPAPAARLHVFAAPSDPNSVGGLIVGQMNPGNLRLGQHADYSWIQSHGSKPLAINGVGNSVAIGTTIPAARLHIVDAEHDPNTATLQLGPTATSHLRLGYHGQYSWIQTGAARPLMLNPQGGNVTIGTTAVTSGDGRLTISAPGTHLQLRREAVAGGGGKVLFLELFQDTTTGDPITFPSIRFHHGNRFWHRIEGRVDGFHFKDGNLGSDALSPITAGAATVASLKIGSITIGENELRILQKLVAGQLQFDLYNVKQDEYAYAADYSPFDNDRRHVFTWRPKGRINQGRWRLDFPG